jgi:hypothetical protein
MNRLITIVVKDIGLDILKHEESIERILNNKNISVDEAILSVKTHLKEITQLKGMMTQLTEYNSEN